MTALPPSPILLAMDTAGAACQVVVARGAEVLACESKPMRRGHGEELVPMVERVLEAAGLDYEDLDRVGVTTGPGSFTGLRVGLAAARGFSATLNIDIIAIGSLEALALSDRSHMPAPAGQAVAVDARNGLVYGQLFDVDGAPLGEPDVMADLVFAASVVPGMRLVGPAQKVIHALVASRGKPVTLGAAEAVPDIAALAHLTLEGDPEAKPQPLYLKPADAVPAKSAGLRAESP